MSKESIIQDFTTRPCGHIDQELLKATRAVDAQFESSHYQLLEEIDPDMDIDLEGMTIEEIRVYLATRLVDFVWSFGGEENLSPCSECEREKLKRWIEASQD